MGTIALLAHLVEHLIKDSSGSGLNPEFSSCCRNLFINRPWYQTFIFTLFGSQIVEIHSVCVSLNLSQTCCTVGIGCFIIFFGLQHILEYC